MEFPSLIGHRGAAALAPENTLAGIRAAHAAGLRWVELDVKLSRDGVPIIFHDARLERTSNGIGLVADMDYQDLAALDAGLWFGAEFHGQPIPSLAATITLLAELGMGLNLELKPCAGRAAATTAAALAVLRAAWPSGLPLLLSSFDRTALLVAQDIAPDMPRGLLLDEVVGDWRSLLSQLEASSFNINGNRVALDLLPEIVAAAAVPVLAYTINDPLRAKALWQAGITGIFTDDPVSLLPVSNQI